MCLFCLCWKVRQKTIFIFFRFLHLLQPVNVYVCTFFALSAALPRKVNANTMLFSLQCNRLHIIFIVFFFSFFSFFINNSLFPVCTIMAWFLFSDIRSGFSCVFFWRFLFRFQLTILISFCFSVFLLVSNGQKQKKKYKKIMQID